MLYTHGEATLANRSDLRKFPVPTLDTLREKRGDEAGNRWQPVPFHTMATAIADAATARGHRIKSEHYNVSKDGFDVFACFDFEGLVPGRTDMGTTLGWRYSNVQRFALKGVSGARVFVCANGAIVGDFVFGHKMTNGHDREVTVGEGLDKWERQTRRMGDFYRQMESVELEQRDSDHLLLEAVRGRIVAPSQLGKIDAEFRSDRSKEQFGERPTIRRLYEAVTEVGKTWRSPRVVERGLRGFPDMALRICGSAELAAALTEGDLGDAEAN